MEAQMLVVSDPPHGAVDRGAVADVLAISVEVARLKVAFAAPEVLRASDPEPALLFAEVARDAGLSVKVVEGADMARVPWPAPLASFTFGREGLVGEFRGKGILVPYDGTVLGVLCRPPAGYVPRQLPGVARDGTGLAVAEGIEGLSCLDLYFERGHGLERVSIVQGVTDFSGLGGLRGSTPAENMATTLSECGHRFERIRLDTRLDGVRPRQRFVAGEAGFDVDLRKNYSFGTLLLRHALESIASELRDVTHYEFASRLACALGWNDSA